MINKKFGSALLVFMVSGLVNAATVRPEETKRDSSPIYHPTKAVSYEDSYHIAGVSWSNDRAIASEADREPSSVEPAKDGSHEPELWLKKDAITDKTKY